MYFIFSLFVIAYGVFLHNRMRHLENEIKELLKKAGAGHLQTVAKEGQPRAHAAIMVEERHPELVEYIRKQQSAGSSKEEIIESLVVARWAKEDVEAALVRAGMVPLSVTDAPRPAVSSKGGDDHVAAFFRWLATDWLMKLGAFLILIAFGWFVSYAFANDWIGPVGRITFGLVLGLLILVAGEWRISSFKNQGAVLMALGAAGVLMTVFAARTVYDFFTPTSALLLMFIVVLFLAVASIRHTSRSLAVLSLVLGYMVPILTDSPAPDFVGLFTYLLVVSSGVLWLSYATGWRVLTILSLVGMSLYSFAAFDGARLFETDTLCVIAYVFVIEYFIAGAAAMLRTKKLVVSDMITAAGIGIFALMWILMAVSDEWQSLHAVAWALVFSIGAFVVYVRTTLREPFYVYGGIAAALLGVATALELSGPALTLAFTFEIAVVVFVSHILLGDPKVTRRISALFIIPCFLSLESVGSSAWYNSVFHEHFAVLASLMAVLGGLGFFLRVGMSEEDRPKLTASSVFIVLSTLYGLVLIWLVVHALFADDTAIMLVLTVYTVLGLWAYVSGNAGGIKGRKAAGIVLLSFVVLRLLLIEVWSLPLFGRVIIFGLVGVLLMSTAFIGRSKRITTSNDSNNNG